MTQEDSDPNDIRDESITETTRRGALAALGLGGLAALGSGGASAQLGGGPEADAMSEYRVPTYRVPESDLDTPGVVGRRVEITAGGSSYSAGDQLVDTGSSWERISAGYDSLSTEDLDSTSFRSAFAAEYHRVPNQDRFGKPYYPAVTIYPKSWVGDPSQSTCDAYLYVGVDAIWRTTPDGSGIEFVDQGVREIDHAAMTPKEHYVTIVDGGDARFFINGSDYGSDATTYQKTGPVHGPYEFGGISFYDGSNWGYIWGEYQGGDSHGGRIIRVTDGTGFSEPLSLTGTEADHIHGLDEDPYNSGTFYAFTGDDDSKTQWYKSTDYGQTWTQITEVGGSQVWRTLRIHFAENYLYWASDTPKASLYRAPRSDLSNYEEVYDMTQDVPSPNDIWAYAATKFSHPNGIFIGTMDIGANGYDSVPQYFYDLDAGEMRIVNTLNLNSGYSRAGVREAAPYPLNQAGHAAARARDVTVSKNFQDPIHVRIQQLME